MPVLLVCDMRVCTHHNQLLKLFTPLTLVLASRTVEKQVQPWLSVLGGYELILGIDCTLSKPDA